MREKFNSLKIEQNILMIFPCRRDNCKVENVSNWMNEFVYMHNQIHIEEKVSEQSPSLADPT